MLHKSEQLLFTFKLDVVLIYLYLCTDVHDGRLQKKIMVSEAVKDLVMVYFKHGYSYRLIHYLLETRHHITVSFSYLQKKVIPSLGLRRRGGMTADIDHILKMSMIEVNNGVAGGEQLRRTLAVKYQLRITRQLSRELVRIVDGEGVERRKQHRLRRRRYISKGPNYTWHLDGYDKLAPYGICIHGCIDGFSRKVVWLKAGITNRRPEVVGQYFIEAVIEEGGFPETLRGDYGTENCLVARLQRGVLGTEKSFRYGKSTSNQRIERWWGHLRNSRSDFWMNHFKLLLENDLFIKENPIHRMCLQYSFLPFIQSQLDETRQLWNSHCIRRQRNGDVLTGIPDVLHTQTDLFGVENFIHVVPDRITQQCLQQCTNNFLNLEQDFCNVVDEIIHNLRLPDPNEIETFEDAKHLYTVLSSLL